MNSFPIFASRVPIRVIVEFKFAIYNLTSERYKIFNNYNYITSSDFNTPQTMTHHIKRLLFRPNPERETTPKKLKPNRLQQKTTQSGHHGHYPRSYPTLSQEDHYYTSPSKSSDQPHPATPHHNSYSHHTP